ncbi:MAG TPA: HD domain-containing protein [Candidatus Paceibacterota bacterium]|jgi:putative hydrolase of HD superfamily
MNKSPKKTGKKVGRAKTAGADPLARFVYEMGIHKQTPRSGFWFLGSGQQSVAEHLFRTAMIAYALAYVTPGVDRSKVLLMALTHDLGEGRTGDPNYVHQRYGRLAERMALEDLAADVPFGQELLDLYNEEQARITPESILVKDADQLEWIASLREEEVKGNGKAKAWVTIAAKRIKTPAGKLVCKRLLSMHPDAWWFDEKDKWFVAREEKHRKKKIPKEKA